MLKEMWKVSENLIDSAQSLPFYALVKFSEEEPDTVREMFKKLFSDEHMNYTDKQKATMNTPLYLTLSAQEKSCSHT